MKWAIYGTPVSVLGELFEPDEVVIATFDEKKDAEDYIEKSKLKKKNPRYRMVYRQKSLLSYCEYASVERYQPEDPPPHNPEIDW